MSSSRVFQLVYRSTFQRGRIDSPLAVLREIVAQSQRNNYAAGVTGFMLFDGYTFLQALEGDELEVIRTYGRISRDVRHRDLIQLATRLLPRREFEHWAMEGHLGRDRDRDILMRHGATGDDLATVAPSEVVLLIKEIAALIAASKD